MKKKTPLVQYSEDELPFSFKKVVITPEKTAEHWQKIASKLKLEDNPEEETDETSQF